MKEVNKSKVITNTDTLLDVPLSYLNLSYLI